MLESVLQLFMLLLFYLCLESIIQRLVIVREGISIHNTNIGNNVHPSLSEFADQ